MSLSRSSYAFSTPRGRLTGGSTTLAPSARALGTPRHAGRPVQDGVTEFFALMTDSEELAKQIMKNKPILGSFSFCEASSELLRNVLSQQALRDAGLFLNPIAFPTAAKGLARVLSVAHGMKGTLFTGTAQCTGFRRTAVNTFYEKLHDKSIIEQGDGGAIVRAVQDSAAITAAGFNELNRKVATLDRKVDDVQGDLAAVQATQLAHGHKIDRHGQMLDDTASFLRQLATGEYVPPRAIGDGSSNAGPAALPAAPPRLAIAPSAGIDDVDAADLHGAEAAKLHERAVKARRKADKAEVDAGEALDADNYDLFDQLTAKAQTFDQQSSKLLALAIERSEESLRKRQQYEASMAARHSRRAASAAVDYRSASPVSSASASPVSPRRARVHPAAAVETHCNLIGAFTLHPSGQFGFVNFECTDPGGVPSAYVRRGSFSGTFPASGSKVLCDVVQNVHRGKTGWAVSVVKKVEAPAAAAPAAALVAAPAAAPAAAAVDEEAIVSVARRVLKAAAADDLGKVKRAAAKLAKIAPGNKVAVKAAEFASALEADPGGDDADDALILLTKAVRRLSAAVSPPVSTKASTKGPNGPKVSRKARKAAKAAAGLSDDATDAAAALPS